MFATLALIVGFSVLAISEFIPTVYFGVLVSLAMLGGLLGNLLWLPMLIRLTEADEVPDPSHENSALPAVEQADASSRCFSRCRCVMPLVVAVASSRCHPA